MAVLVIAIYSSSPAVMPLYSSVADLPVALVLELTRVDHHRTRPHARRSGRVRDERSRELSDRALRRHLRSLSLVGRPAREPPTFEVKAAHVIRLYVNLPQHAAAFAADEKTAI